MNDAVAAVRAARDRRNLSGYVLDASVAVTALSEPGSQAADLLAGNDGAFGVPSIFDAEVLSALRGLVRGGKFDPAADADLVVGLMVLPVTDGTCRPARACGDQRRSHPRTMPPMWPWPS